MSLLGGVLVLIARQNSRVFRNSQATYSPLPPFNLHNTSRAPNRWAATDIVGSRQPLKSLEGLPNVH